MYLWADVDPTLLGGWFIAFFAVLAATWMGRQIYVSFFPTKREGEIPVTEAKLEKGLQELEDSFKVDFEEHKEAVAEKIQSHKDDTLEKLTELKEKLERLSGYAHKSVYGIRDAAHQTSIRAQELLAKVNLLWEFHLRRGKAEALNKGLMTEDLL